MVVGCRRKVDLNGGHIGKPVRGQASLSEEQGFYDQSGGQEWGCRKSKLGLIHIRKLD